MLPVCVVVFLPAWRSLWHDMEDKTVTTGELTTADLLGLLRDRWAGLFFAAAVVWAVSVAYDLLLTKWRGQTVGKFLCHVRVVDQTTGTGVTWRQAAIRAGIPGVLTSVGSVTPAGGVLVGLDYLMPAWDPARRTLHDRAAGTIVVEGASAPRAVPSPAPASIPEMAR